MSKCSFKACPRSIYAKGLCSAHYHQKRVGGVMRPLPPKKQCSSVGCERDASSRGMCHSCFLIVRMGSFAGLDENCKIKGCNLRHTAKGFCFPHYMAHKFGRYNKILGPAERRRMQSKEVFDE